MIICLQQKSWDFIYSRQTNFFHPRNLDDLAHNNKVPCLKKQKTLGGTGDDFGSQLIPTRDGGFIVCGGTYSADGDFKVPAANGGDAFIAKYNRSRQLQWTKTMGGTGEDVFSYIAQTSDGGYIATGKLFLTMGILAVIMADMTCWW